MKFKIAAFVMVLMAASMMRADAIPAGPGAITGSWTQGWTWTGTVIDSMKLQMLSGSTWEHPLHGFNNGWVATGFSPTVVTAGGPLSVNFTFATDFVTNINQPLSWRWFGYNGTQLIDVGVATWNGQFWTTQAEDPNSVPEPGTLALLGTGLAGLIRLRRRA